MRARISGLWEGTKAWATAARQNPLAAAKVVGGGLLVIGGTYVTAVCATNAISALATIVNVASTLTMPSARVNGMPVIIEQLETGIFYSIATAAAFVGTICAQDTAISGADTLIGAYQRRPNIRQHTARIAAAVILPQQQPAPEPAAQPIPTTRVRGEVTVGERGNINDIYQERLANRHEKSTQRSR